MKGQQSNFACFALNSAAPKAVAVISSAAPSTLFILEEAQSMHMIH
jgi:uncharacterized protein (DUF1778 family)